MRQRNGEDERYENRDVLEHGSRFVLEEAINLHFEDPRNSRANLFRERFEPRVAVQRIEKRVHPDPANVSSSVILIALFQPAEGLFFVAEPEVNKGKTVGCDISLLR